MPKEITLKRCPICGSCPERQVDDMGTGSYQHYYGAYNYIYKCPKCGMLHVSRNTVYLKTGEEADKKAKQDWNAECDKWEKTLAWRKDKKPEASAQTLPPEPKAKRQKVLSLLANGYSGCVINTDALESSLADGWRVVDATSVMTNIDHVSATKQIIYILEKEED